MKTTQYQFRRDDDNGELNRSHLAALFELASDEQDKTYELARRLRIVHGVDAKWIMDCSRDWSQIRSCLADLLELPRSNDYGYGAGLFEEHKAGEPRYTIDNRSLPVWGDHRPRPVFLSPGQVAILADAAWSKGHTSGADDKVWGNIAETLFVGIGVVT